MTNECKFNPVLFLKEEVAHERKEGALGQRLSSIWDDRTLSPVGSGGCILLEMEPHVCEIRGVFKQFVANVYYKKTYAWLSQLFYGKNQCYLLNFIFPQTF